MPINNLEDHYFQSPDFLFFILNFLKTTMILKTKKNCKFCTKSLAVTLGRGRNNLLINTSIIKASIKTISGSLWKWSLPLSCVLLVVYYTTEPRVTSCWKFSSCLTSEREKTLVCASRSSGVVQPPTAKNSLHQSHRTIETHGVYDDVIILAMTEQKTPKYVSPIFYLASYF